MIFEKHHNPRKAESIHQKHDCQELFLDFELLLLALFLALGGRCLLLLLEFDQNDEFVEEKGHHKHKQRDESSGEVKDLESRRDIEQTDANEGGDREIQVQFQEQPLEGV